jgi:hypothetical protein
MPFLGNMGWVGLEPTTNALKGRCSTIELPTLGKRTRTVLLKRIAASSFQRGLGMLRSELGSLKQFFDTRSSLTVCGSLLQNSINPPLLSPRSTTCPLKKTWQAARLPCVVSLRKITVEFRLSGCGALQPSPRAQRTRRCESARLRGAFVAAGLTESTSGPRDQNGDADKDVHNRRIRLVPSSGHKIQVL